MSWSEIYSRSGDPISDSILDLKTRANLADAIEEQITVSDKISPVRILTSRLRVTDQDMFSAYARIRSSESRYYMPFEPDGKKVRLDIKFDHGGEFLTDHSYQANNCIIGYATEQPVLRKNPEDDGVTAGEICSIYNGVEHHVKVENAPPISLKQMCEVDLEPGFAFKKRIYFLTLANELRSTNTKRATIAHFIENDQVEYGVKVEVDDTGKIYFFVRDRFQDFWLATTTSQVTLAAELPDYFTPDFNPDNFDAESEVLTSINPVPFVDLGFTYNFQTKKMQIYKNGVLVTESPNVRANSPYSSGIYASSAFPPQAADLSLWLPLTAGGGENKLRDLSGKNNHSNIVNSTRKPTWITHLSNRRALEFFAAAGSFVPVTKTATLNTLTSFTVAFFAYLHADYYSIANSKVLFSFAASGNGRFLIYTTTGSSREVRMDVTNNAGTTRFLGFGSLSLPSPAPALAHIVITYDGVTYKCFVNKVQTQFVAAFTGDAFTNSGNITVGGIGANLGGHENLSHVMFWKNRALTLTEIQELYDTLVPTVEAIPNTANILKPANTPPFPPAWDDPPPPPAVGQPIQLPFTEVMNYQTQNTQVKINKVTTSNLTNFYNVPGGTPVTDPQTILYDVDPGTGSNTTAPFTDVYSLAGANSTGQIEDGSGELAYGQYIRTTTSNLFNRKITEIQVWLNGLGNPVGGSVWIGIIKANGTNIKFGTAIDPATIPDAWTSYTKQNLTNSYLMAVGDAVGVIWESHGSGAVNIRRGGSGVHEETEDDPSDSSIGMHSCQNKLEDDLTWGTPNEEFAMAGTFKIGGDTVVTTPYITISNYSGAAILMAEHAATGSALIGKTITKAQFRVYRENVAAVGTVSIRHIKADGTFWETLATMNVADLPITEPTTFNIQWENVAYSRAMILGDKIGVVCSGVTGAKVYCLANTVPTGSPDNYDTNKSYLVTRTTTTWWTNTGLDLSGKMWIGGNDFVPYLALDNTRKRIGEQATAAASILVGKVITSVKITAKKANNPPAGAIYCRIRDGAGVLKFTIGQRDISEVLATDTILEFTDVNNNYPMALNDFVSIEYDQGTATDNLLIKINKNQVDAANTIMVEAYAATIDTEQILNDRDLAGEMFTGGQIDTAARPMRGIKIKAGSILIGKAITEARIKLKRTGTFGAGENMSVKIIRNSDKVVASTLDVREINTISTSAFTEYIFQETGNAYSLVEGDFIGVENNFGDSTTKFIEIAINNTNPFDTTKTIMFNYNGTAYVDDSTFDMIAKLYTGGNTVFPDPDIPIEPNPFHYFHGWVIGAAQPPDSNALVKPVELLPESDTYIHAFVKQFRLYSMILTQAQFNNYFNNRFTITPITFGEVEIVGHDITGFDV